MAQSSSTVAARLRANGAVERLRVTPRAAPIVLGGLMVVCAALLLYAGRGFIFYYDEWAFVINRRGWTVDTFLFPHNEHISALPIAVYKLLFATAGLDHYWVYRVVLTAFHLVAVGLLYVLVRRRVGSWLAVAFVTPVLFLGSAWENILWPFQIGLIGSVVFGLAMLLALERGDRTGNALACVCLVLSLSSSSVGLSFIVAALVEIVLRERDWRRLWVPLVPALLYAVWWVQYAPSELQGGGSPTRNILEVPAYVAESAAGALGGLTSLGTEWGRPLALLVAVLVVRFAPWGTGVTARFWAVLATMLASWSLSAIGRAQLDQPAASRYIYTGAILIVMLGTELARDARPSRRAGIVLTLAVCAAAVGNIGELRAGRAHLLPISNYVQSSLAALELAGPSVQREFRPEPIRAPNIYAGDYFDAVRQYGSPAESIAAMKQEEEVYRQAADATLVGAFQVTSKPGDEQIAGGPPLGIDEPHWGTTSADGPCLTFTPNNAGAAIDATVPGPGIVVTSRQSAGSPVQVALRRFGDAFPPPGLLIPGEGTSVLRLPRGSGADDRPWHVRLFATAPLRVCSLAR
ncbi:MAG: hypothetical protein WKF65_18200 [Gaiellaceae bacterium]